MSDVEYERRGRIEYIRLNRPHVLNALTDATVVELRETLFRFDDDQEAHVAILSGNGRAFCSGADVRQRQNRTMEEFARLGSSQGRNAHVEDVFYRFTNWKPMIAAIHGYCVGAGLYLMMQSQVIVAAEGTQFQITETSRGVGGGAHIFYNLLAYRTNGGFASDVAVTGRFWSAEEALPVRAIDRLAPQGKHIEVAEEVAEQILKHPPLAVRAVVEATRLVMEGIEYTARLSRPRRLHLSEDYRESATAFLEKRPTRPFKGR